MRNNNGTEFVTSARFALDFRKSLNSYDAATNVCNNPEYQTLYLPLNGKAFDTVEFNFTACHTRGRMFITEIYVVNPGVELEKTVKVNDGSATKELVNAKLGDILTYAIDVKNSGVLQVNKAVVTDVLPAGVTFKEAMNGGIYDEATNSVTWEVTDLAAGETKKVEFIVTVNDDFLGLIKNVAKTLTVNDKEFNTTSNEVYVEVRGVNTQKEYVFYNEVDKLNTLPIHLGATEIEIKEKQPGESLAVTKNIEIKEVDGGGYENYPKKEFELNFGTEKAGKHDITMFTTENGNFILKEVVINNKTYTTNKQNIRDKINGIFSNYEGVDDNGFGFVDSTERLSGLGNGKFITFKDVDIPADGTVKFQFYIRTYKEKIFPMTVDYNMVGPEKEVVIGTVWAPDQLLADQPEIGNGNNAVSIDANGNVKYRYTGDEAPFTDTFYVHYKSATGVDNNEDKNPVYPDDGYKTVKVIVHNYKAKDYVYVLDYGLPVSLTGNGTNLAADIDEYAELHLQNGDGAYFTGFRTEKRGGAEVVTDDYVTEYGELESMKTTNGTVSTTWADPNAEELTATYTPQRFMDCADIFYYGVQVTASNAHPTYYVSNATPVMEGKIKVVPANVVYYEDNFAHSKKDDVDGDNGIIYEGSVTFVEGDSRFQNNSFDVQYGYDATYAEDDEYSGDNVAELPKGTCATFQFKGTGFDILSRTNNNTGDIMVAVYDVDKDHAKVVRDPETRKTKVINAETDDVAKYISLRSVNTYYENGDLYQVPVISEDLGKYGNYIVRVVATGKVGTSIYLDGIRIYNPAGVGENADDNVVSEYLPEEQNAEFIEVRSMILGKGYQFNFKNPIESIPGESPCATLVQWPGDNNGLFLNGMTVVENFTGDYEHPSNITGNTNHLLTYATQGPNNELYLENGYAIAFNVTPDDNEADNTLQIGVKQVTGEPNLVYLSQNGDWQSLIPNGDPVKSATELYYKIPVNDCFEGVVVLGVQNDGVISFTNVKNSGYEMYALTDEQMKELAWTTPDGGLIAESTLSVLASLKNKNLMVTFAASNQVTGVVVTDENENEVTITTASYIFSDANNNTWTVCFAAEKNTKYTLTAFTEAGTYEILSELEY